MAARAYWKGYLKLSLVSCPIQLFPALSAREKTRFHQINRKTGNRIKYCKLDAVTGEPVSDEEIVKGYEVRRGRYVEITDDELEAVAIESTHTIKIDQFVPKSEIDEIYWNIPYYIAPEGEVGQQAFAVIREAIKKKDMVALGHVVLTTREHVIAVEPRGKGMLGVTLRYPYEIRKAADYFDEIPDGKVPEDMLDLAVQIIETNAGHFAPEKFEDRYETALKELIKKKQRGEKIEKPKERPRAPVVNLMDALRQSAAAKRGGARGHPRRAAIPNQRTPANRLNARARKAS
ncbi:MAG: end-binding protein Ku [Alphaproteobacteria bacterium]|nr:end-binding protein Ku [Alphaproteobacteria bacterium]